LHFLDSAVRQEIDRCDVVVDLVAYANPSVYVESPLETFQLNFLQNLKIVDLCVENRKKIIQYSTCEVYGRPSGPTYKEDETELICGPVGKQRWIYSAGKQLLERVIHAYSLEGRSTTRSSGPSTSSARASTTSSPRETSGGRASSPSTCRRF